MLDNETKRRIDTARDILVGKLPDPKSQVEQITIALIYKFMDDMDAESVSFGGEPSFFVGDYEKYGWRKLLDLNLSGFETLALYGEAMTKLHENENLPQLFRDIFKNAYLPYRDPETLKLFLKTINGFTYDHSERLGDAFEYLLSVLGSQGDAGQFRTPRHIIDFIVKVLDPQKTETISDPACGTAGFLISAYKHILQNNQNLTPNERRRLMTNFAGYDISPDMVRLSLVNMYLHGFPAPHIYEYDSLTSEDRWSETFDIVIANPPFMSPKGGIKPHKKFSINANRSEVLFVDYIAEHIHPTHGRAGIIVPEGIIFQSAGAYRDLRRMLVDKAFLYAVVSLPAGVFQPYSGVKTSVLLMDKTIAGKTDKILFVKIQNDGFALSAQRKQLQTTDLTDSLNVIRDFQKAVLNGDDTSRFLTDDLPLQSFAVEKSLIAKNKDFNLSSDKYKKNIVHKSEYEIVELGEYISERSERSKNNEFDALSVSKEFGFIKSSDFFDVKVASENLSNYKIIRPNYFAFNPARINVGSIALNSKGLSGCVSPMYSVFEVKDKEKLLPIFLFQLLKSDIANTFINQKAQGSIRNVLKFEDLESFQIPLPPLSIQKEIVEKIEGFQRIIDGAKAVVENYKPQIDISPDWEMVELGEVGELKNGINYTKESTGAFVQVLGVKDFKSNFYAPLDSFATIQIDNELNGEYSLKENDIVFVRSNGNPDLIGRNVVIPKLDFKATFSGFTIRLRITSPKVFPLFYAHLLKTDSVRKMLTDSGTGANIKSLNQTSLKELTLPLPPLEVQQEIVARIEREQRLINSNKELIQIFEAKIKDEINKLWEE